MALGIVLALTMLTMGVSAQAENKLTASWQKGFVSAVEQKTDEDGTPYVSAMGIENSWYSPFINVYDAVKAVVGEEEEAEVMFVFEMRVKFKDESDAGTPVAVRAVIRPSGCSEEIKNQDLFLETYQNEEGMFKNDGGNVMGYFDSSMSTFEVTDEWTVFECSHLISKTDLNDSWWTGWDLCVDQINDYELIEALEFRNTGVYSYDDYESIIPEPTEAPATPEPTPTVVPATPVGFVTSSTTAPAVTATEDTASGEQNEGDITSVIVVCVVAAVVIAAVIVGIVVVKKKKAGDVAENSDEKNKKE